MILLPAIDLLNGRAVRLYKGLKDNVTDYGDPVEIAASFRAQGAQWLHLVDLTGAFEGKGGHEQVIPAIVKAFNGPVETGGGIRTMEDIARRIEDWGVSRVILGTVAVTNPDLVAEACERYPGQIACGIDAKDGWVAVKGWVEKSTLKAAELALRMKHVGVNTVIYTDIDRDGAMRGPNVTATAALISETGMEIIGSGGVNTLESLVALKKVGCAGAITGKAVYEKAFTIAEALEAVK